MNTESLKNALADIAAGMSLSKAARKYGINKGYLSAFLAGYRFALKPHEPALNARLTGEEGYVWDYRKIGLFVLGLGIFACAVIFLLRWLL